jgi:transposase
MTTQAVARHLQIGWDLVRKIEQENLERHYSRPKLRDVRQIAIDEIAVRKGHRYLTVVLDLDTGRVIYVGDGKGEDALNAFWCRLRASHAKVEAVATDLSSAYIAAVRHNLPDATLVFDHFHIVKLLNDRLTVLRRELYREAKDRMHKEVLKGTRWLLLKRPENLNDSRNERARLQQALDLNESLAMAYYLKEDLKQLWAQGDPLLAEGFLDDWCRQAELSGVRQLQKFAKTLRTHRRGIIAWYDYPISTGPLEGTNNKIKTIKRQAYGYRNLQYFKLKILALHRTQYSLVG